MRLRHVPGARETIEAHTLCFTEGSPQAGNWHNVFGNKHPVHVEIGMGKGLFLTTIAGQHPENNYVGIERCDSVLIRAVEKTNAMENPPENIRFVRMDAADICSMFDTGEADRIYLNFSDPWPKDRHAKRRLTCLEFLKRYDKILSPNGQIELKTDNRDFFNFSIEQAKLAGWNVDSYTHDLHHNKAMNRDNVITEYETRFSARGNPILKMVLSHSSAFYNGA